MKSMTEITLQYSFHKYSGVIYERFAPGYKNIQGVRTQAVRSELTYDNPTLLFSAWNTQYYVI